MQTDDVFDDPKKFGMPTFEEFKKNREKYLAPYDDVMRQVDRGSTHLSKITKKYFYEFEGCRCRSLEEVERIARDHGVSLQELGYTAEIMPIGGGKCDILVKFISKAERERRDRWR